MALSPTKRPHNTNWFTPNLTSRDLTWRRYITITRGEADRGQSIAKPGAMSLAKPLQQLMDAAPSSVPNAGHRAITWLKQQSDQNRALFLRRLSRVAMHKARSTSETSLNVIGVVEALTWFQDNSAFQLIEVELAKRPLGAHHLLLVGLCATMAARLHDVQNDSIIRSIRTIASDLTAMPSGSQASWQRQLSVAVVRTLATISPHSALEVFCSVAGRVSDLEITALLDDVSKATRTLETKERATVHSIVEQLWERYGSVAQPQGTLNPSGITARLLGLYGATGESLERVLGRIKGRADYHVVLYLLAQNAKQFASPNDRLQLYAETAKQLAASDQKLGIRKLLETASADKDVDILEVLRIASC